MALSKWRMLAVGIALAVSAAHFAFSTILIMAGALYGGPDWRVALVFNGLGEGPMEIILFSAVLALLLLANYYFWREGQ